MRVPHFSRSLREVGIFWPQAAPLSRFVGGQSRWSEVFKQRPKSVGSSLERDVQAGAPLLAIFARSGDFLTQAVPLSRFVGGQSRWSKVFKLRPKSVGSSRERDVQAGAPLLAIFARSGDFLTPAVPLSRFVGGQSRWSEVFKLRPKSVGSVLRDSSGCPISRDLCEKWGFSGLKPHRKSSNRWRPRRPTRPYAGTFLAVRWIVGAPKPANLK